MTSEYWRNSLKDDDVFHYDKTLIRQLCYGFIFFWRCRSRKLHFDSSRKCYRLYKEYLKRLLEWL